MLRKFLESGELQHENDTCYLAARGPDCTMSNRKRKSPPKPKKIATKAGTRRFIETSLERLEERWLLDSNSLLAPDPFEDQFTSDLSGIGYQLSAVRRRAGCWRSGWHRFAKRGMGI